MFPRGFLSAVGAVVPLERTYRRKPVGPQDPACSASF
jgi:hypothetical protein